MKERLDVELVNRGLVESRERAKAYIMAGIVYVDDQKAMKAGDKVSEGQRLEIRGSTLKYVSRGGLKLEKAIDSFGIDLAGFVCADVGASTGGFTDCMLQNGAVKVYSIDVGYGQLAWKLRSDDRVVNIERTNVRYLDMEVFEEDVDFSSIDVSFISLKLVLPVVHSFLREGGTCVALIKPQFEAQREDVGKKGVIKDKAVHIKVIDKCLNIARELGFGILGLDYSPIKGPEGNIEFLMYIKKGLSSDDSFDDEYIKNVVDAAHNETK